jgi:hypothetical protein
MNSTACGDAMSEDLCPICQTRKAVSFPYCELCRNVNGLVEAWQRKKSHFKTFLALAGILVIVLVSVGMHWCMMCDDGLQGHRILQINMAIQMFIVYWYVRDLLPKHWKAYRKAHKDFFLAFCRG